MAGLSSSGVLDDRMRKTLLRVALVVAVVIAGIAVKYQAHKVLAAHPVAEWNNRAYGLLRFKDSNTVVGLRQQGTKVIVDQWKGGSEEIKRRSLELGEEVPVSALRIAPDASLMAWTTGPEVWVHDLEENSAAVRIPTRRGASLVDVAVMREGSLIILFSDGLMQRWEAMAQKLQDEQQIPLSHPDQIAADEDYIAAASSSEGKLVLYRQWLGSHMRVTEEVQCPSPPFQLIMAGQGQAPLIIPGGVFLNGNTLNTPGRVRSLAFGAHGALIVAGDFDGLYSVTKDADPFKIADVPSGGVIVASEDYMVYSSPSGTRVLSFGNQIQLTDRGKSLMWVGGIFAFMALMVMMDKVMLGVFYQHPTARVAQKRLDVSRSFGEPSEELVEAAKSGGLALWAGSGLSAQCGFPIRRNFAGQMLEAGRFDGWLNNTDANALQGLCDRGMHEEAMEALVTERPENRTVVSSMVKGAYRKTLDPSPAHKWLGMIPFCSAITTNYDALLEELGVAWGRNLYHPKMRRGRDAVVENEFFLIKLYGDLFRPHTVLLTRQEAMQELEQPDGLAPLVANVLAKKSILFVGCSVDGLLGDLAKFPPKKPLQTHYLLAGIYDQNWKKKASQLSKWGIRVIPCAEDAISHELPVFLEKLAIQVNRRPRQVTSDPVAAPAPAQAPAVAETRVTAPQETAEAPKS